MGSGTPLAHQKVGQKKRSNQGAGRDPLTLGEGTLLNSVEVEEGLQYWTVLGESVLVVSAAHLHPLEKDSLYLWGWNLQKKREDDQSCFVVNWLGHGSPGSPKVK